MGRQNHQYLLFVANKPPILIDCCTKPPILIVCCTKPPNTYLFVLTNHQYFAGTGL